MLVLTEKKERFNSWGSFHRDVLVGGSHEKKEGHFLVMELELIFFWRRYNLGCPPPPENKRLEAQNGALFGVSQLGALPKSLSKIGAFFN